MTAMETLEIPANAQETLPEKRCYSVEELQVILGISRGSVYKLLARNEFRWFKVGPIYRVSKKSFDTWLDERM